jgi:hypothetical protein
MPAQAMWRSTPVVLALTVIAGSMVSPASTEGSTVRFRTDAELVALSERVVHGRVLRQRTERPRGAAGSIYTVTTLAVLEDLTGIPGETLEVWELGGVFGGEAMLVGGAVTYVVGAEVLVCLERGRLGYRSIAMGFSKFDVEPIMAAGGASNGRLSRGLRDTTVIGGSLPRDERTLSEFRDLTSRVRGVRPARNRGAELLEPEERTSQSFTQLIYGNGLGARWVEADSGTPVRWYLNTSAPSPLISGSGASELQTALAAWTAPASATLALQYAGTTLQNAPGGSTGDADGPWNGIPSTGTGVVTFEDPYDEISGGILALGGGWVTAPPNGGGTVNGTVFNKFTRGFVLFQNASDLPPSFRQSQNFARVLEHEIGHAIGLGHSDAGSANIMYASCCSGSTPLAPQLGPDDLAGLNFIYPSGAAPPPPPPPPPPACAYAISPTSLAASFHAGNSSVVVATTASCTWTATSNSSFLTITGGGSGSGNGTVTFHFAPNTSKTPRTRTLTIAGRTFSVNQAAAPARGIPDVDGDGLADLTVFRPGTTEWFVRKSSSHYGYGDYLSFQWGLDGDTPLAADFDGDGAMDLTVFRPSTGEWFIRNSSSGYSYAYTSFQWGLSTDVPLVADFDGDGRTDLVVYRPSTGEWFIRYSSQAYGYPFTSFQWGLPGDTPIVADFDGDGRTDLTVYRPSTREWFIRFSSSEYSYSTWVSYTWGLPDDVPLAADFDGDGRTDLVVYRPSDGTWYMRFSSSAYSFATWTSYRWGLPDDTPIVADFDGDGRSDLVVFRPSSGEWFVRYSTTEYSYSGFATYQWGLPEDVPMMPR